MSKNKKPTDDAPFNFNTLQRPSPSSKSTASPMIKLRMVQESPPSHHPSVGGKRPPQDQIMPHEDDQRQYTNII